MTVTVRDNKYFAQKLKEYRERQKKARGSSNKNFFRNYFYTIEVNRKNYVYQSKQDIKINKIHKNEIPPEYIKTF